MLPDVHDIDTPLPPTTSTAAEARLIGRHIVGAKLSKSFAGHDGIYHGRIVAYEAASKLYSVAYDDGDKEDMYLAEAEKVLCAEDGRPPGNDSGMELLPAVEPPPQQKDKKAAVRAPLPNIHCKFFLPNSF